MYSLPLPVPRVVHLFYLFILSFPDWIEEIVYMIELKFNFLVWLRKQISEIKIFESLHIFSLGLGVIWIFSIFLHLGKLFLKASSVSILEFKLTPSENKETISHFTKKKKPPW